MIWMWIKVLFVAALIGSGLSYMEEPGESVINSYISRSPNSPLQINNSSHLEEMAILESWEGNGSEGNPFIIDNLEIDGNRSKFCIFIQNTQEHIIIRNCILYDGGYRYFNYFNPGSLFLFNCANITVIDCEIDFIEAEDSTDLKISDIYWQADNRTVIYIDTCMDVIIEDLGNCSITMRYSGSSVIENCTVNDMNSRIYIYSGPWYYGHIVVKNCTIKNTVGDAFPEGILVRDSYYTHLYDNVFVNSFPKVETYGYEGFFRTVTIPPNNTVNGKSIQAVIGKDLQWEDVPGGGGYYLFLQSKNISVKNVVLAKDSIGFSIQSCSGVSLDGISLPGETMMGMYFFQTDGISINGSIFHNMTDGVRIDQVMDFNITNTTFSGCERGLVLNYAYLGDTYPSRIKDTEFIDCMLGIRGNDFDSVEVKDCRFERCQVGMEVERSYGWRIHENSFLNCNLSAIKMLRGSMENWVYWNTFRENNVENGTQKIQVEDESEITRWYNPSYQEGNLWYDHTEPDLDRNGIVDDPYSISVSGAEDPKPLTTFPRMNLETPEDFAIEVEDGKVEITWKRAPQENTPVISGYRIYRNRTGNDTITRIDVDAGKWSFTDGMVEFGKEYNYWMTVYNLREESEPTDVLSTFIFDKPGTVFNFSYSCNRTSLNLTWDPPIDDGGSPVTGYRIYRSLSPIAWTWKGISNTTHFVDENIEIGEVYYYFVSSMNVVGEGSLSDPFEAEAFITPDPPNLSVVSTGKDFIKLSWNAPEFSGGTEIVSYRIYRGTDGATLTELYTLGSNLVEYNDTGLEEGSTFYYAVSSVNSRGESELSNVLNVTVGMIRPDLPRPFNPTAVSGNGNVVISFNAPDFNNDLVFLHFHIYRREEGFDFTLLSTTASTRYRDDTVINEVSYDYRITAVYTNGESGPTPIVNATPSADISPYGLPRELTSSSGDGFVILRWIEPADQRNGSIQNYNIYTGNSSEVAVIEGSVDVSQRSVTINDLENGRTYRFYISAVYLQGESALAGPVEATPKGVDRAPGQPRSLEVVLNETGVLLEWTSASGNVDGYRIYRSEGSKDAVIIDEVSSETLTYIDASIVDGASYRYSVCAFNSQGEGQRSIDVLITIPIEEIPEEGDSDDGLETWIYFAIGGAIILMILLLVFILARRKGPDYEE